MKREEIVEYICIAAFISYVVGIPIAFGYMYHLTGGDPHQGFGVFIGAFFWPLVLLGRIGYLLA